MSKKAKNKTNLCKKATITTISMMLVASFLVPIVIAGNPDLPELDIKKTGPVFAYIGDEITYIYNVSNVGDVPINNITVNDDKCGPVTFVSGDTNNNSKLDLVENWVFSCAYTPESTFPNPLVNTAEVKGRYNGETIEDDVEFKLYPFILRKEVLLYWEGENIDYDDPETQFTIKITKSDECLGTFTISESEEKHLWLSEGSYEFTEINIPDGYESAYDNITHITGENYPDFTQINVITFDLAIDKSGPKCAHPGDIITYTYKVTNKGPASVTPVVEDDKCGTPQLVSGDCDKDGLIDPSETWMLESDYEITQDSGCLRNKVNVTDAEGLGLSQDQWWLGGDRNLKDNKDCWKVCIKSIPDEPEEPEEPEEPDEPEEPKEPTTTATRSPVKILKTNFIPIANASGIYSANIEEDIEFDGSGSFDLDGTIVHFGWSFGDGSVDFGEKVTHSYKNGGTYLVTLTVIDDKGATDTDTTKTIINVPNRPPTASVIKGPENGSKDTKLSYVFGSSDLDNDDISYIIDWGDGTSLINEGLPSGHLFSILHSWPEAGEYKIQVTASDNQTLSQAEMKVVIEENIVADNIVVIGLGILVIIALLVVLMHSKKGKK